MSLAFLECPTAPPWSVDWEALPARVPWLRPMIGCEQDPRWHPEGDVWTHTTLVGQAMVDEPEWRALPGELREQLFAAAVLHDLGKPDTTKQEPDGSITSIGHPRHGAQWARRELWQLGVERAARERVCALIRLHAIPYWAMQRRNIARDIMAMAHRVAPRLLHLLARCDAHGKGTTDTASQLARIALFAELATELGCIDGPFPFPSDHARVQYFRSKDRDPSYAPRFEPHCTVTLTCGLPGAGKTHWVQQHCDGLDVVSQDALVQEAKRRARVLLRAGRDFVWDATNLVPARRRALIGLFLDYDARVRIVHVEAPEAMLRARNAARDEPVPDEALERMIRRWEPPDATEAHEVVWVDG